ncbi:3-hydroxyacyl-CoA dehydrogenase family protein [Chloroflexota bacterium]
MEIKEIMIVGGGGVTGAGVVQVCAQAGYSVIMQDINQEALAKGMDNIKWSVGKLVNKGDVKGTVDEIMSKIKATTIIEDARGADLVIEAVFEDLELKKDVFHQLSKLCSSETIMATNTSAIPITNIAEGMERPDKFVGIHFFIPIVMQPLVEVIKGKVTSEETMKIAIEFCQSLKKEVARVDKDVYGFAMVRIDMAGYVEAMKLLEEGVASIEDIDKGMRLGYSRAMGPFEQRDFGGLDLGLTLLENLYKETGDVKFFPPVILRRKVMAGHLGRKVGIGWYKYDEKGNKIGPA